MGELLTLANCSELDGAAFGDVAKSEILGKKG